VGRLAGFSAAAVAKKLRKLGFMYDRQGAGSHEIWRHPDGRRTTLVNHPGDVKEGTLRNILREAGIDVDQFLDA
jgi:predicted RNA binding protein YcfA (HicA-like mRNA interferase family)